MRSEQIRTIPLARVRQHELVAVLENFRPRASDFAEDLVYYLMLSAFWGAILYIALTYALP
ncbi:MAG: hypothetical protein NVSMB52_20120 [Chloroflexota bacterium]